MNDSSWGPATVLVVVLTTLVVLIGGVVCVFNPDELSFSEYTERLAWLAGAVGALGIGRGILGGKKAEAQATVEAANATAAVTNTVHSVASLPAVPEDFLGEPPDDGDDEDVDEHEKRDLHEGGLT